MIPEAAVEAAWATFWDVPHIATSNVTKREVRLALEAAATHMLAPGTPERGEGDYLPGWDDRKTLASLWQEHAMLPVDGLSERVYEALIAVATWGYEQRKAEDL